LILLPSDAATSCLRRPSILARSVEIHGLPNGFGYIGALHRATDWTYGCIAVTDAEMDEIYRLVPDNTPIDIQP
jgi:murein L,D-transpeptidase YafK